MAFPTQPAQDPEWASAGTITVPTLAKRAIGWIFQEKPPFDFFNWYMLRVYEWIVFLRGYLNVEHDIADGHHTVVYVKTRLDVEASDAIRYVLGAATPSSRDVIFDLGSPEKGGWQVVAGVLGAAFDFNIAAAPSNTATQGAADTFTVSRDLSFLVVGQDDALAGDQWEINRVRFHHRRNAAGDTATYAIFSMARNGNAAPTNETGTIVGSVTGGVYAEDSAAYAIAVNPGRRYWVVCAFASDVGSAAGEAGMAGLEIRVARRHLE